MSCLFCTLEWTTSLLWPSSLSLRSELVLRFSSQLKAFQCNFSLWMARVLHCCCWGSRRHRHEDQQQEVSVSFSRTQVDVSFRTPFSTIIFTLKALFNKPADQLAPVLVLSLFLERGGYPELTVPCQDMDTSFLNSTALNSTLIDTATTGYKNFK